MIGVHFLVNELIGCVLFRFLSWFAYVFVAVVCSCGLDLTRLEIMITIFEVVCV